MNKQEVIADIALKLLPTVYEKAIDGAVYLIQSLLGVQSESD